ncbi:MFS transporter [Streptomyces akebiae]|uniref:MFS transporter n=1 Tax=Streptomyces akebiae TaxID=2865673 RepID=A0ABX8XIS0_9ACTN|nr:MFS transporter [Streptomyces akebiae]QYX75841.1 MFS transporter [Streptomyces akebiae]
MTTRGGTLQAPSDLPFGDRERPPARLPLVVYVLALATFLMGTTEFVVAGLLPEIATDVQVGVARAGLLVTVFAVGMVVGAPLMAMLTLRLPRRWTLLLALAVFAAGHVIVALSTSFTLVLAARFLTALATGAFWAVANVVATRAVGPAASSRALGVVGAGAMLANVVGVPLGAFAGQLIGWRGPFWALAALAVAAMTLIARHVPHDGPAQEALSLRSELSALRSGHLWLALAACATTTGGVLSAYSYVSPLLTDRAGLASSLVPLVLAGFGIGALAGFLAGGRLGDRHPYATTIMTPAVTTALLLATCLSADHAVPTIALIALLGLFGLGANPVLIALAVRFAGRAPTLGSALTVSAFNLGTATGSWAAAIALESPLGAGGPAAVGAVIAALTLIPTTIIALTQHRLPSPWPSAATGNVRPVATPGTPSRRTGRKREYVQYEGFRPAHREHAPPVSAALDREVPPRRRPLTGKRCLPRHWTPAGNEPPSRLRPSSGLGAPEPPTEEAAAIPCLPETGTGAQGAGTTSKEKPPCVE